MSLVSHDLSLLSHDIQYVTYLLQAIPQSSPQPYQVAFVPKPSYTDFYNVNHMFDVIQITLCDLCNAVKIWSQVPVIALGVTGSVPVLSFIRMC